MNMSSRFHNRDHYEIILQELRRLAGMEPVAIKELSNTELLLQINNWLAYYNLETFTLDEIEDIAEALEENKTDVKEKVIVPVKKEVPEGMFDDTGDPFFDNTSKIPVDKDGNYLTKEKKVKKT
jgi:F0F1-type ATP synthase beta subunit